MPRIDLPDVPDDVHATSAAGAEAAGQSLAAFVVDRLVEITRPTPGWPSRTPWLPCDGDETSTDPRIT